jgi:4-alpha-glucanotransferase
MTHAFRYDEFLRTPSRRQWERLGLHRRAGIAAALFSVYSSESIGLGEAPDLQRLIDWCRDSGMSLLQLLPLNDTGFDFQPYSAQSSFALDPMYLSLEHVKDVNHRGHRRELAALRKKFPTSGDRVDYGVKRAKLDYLWKLFESWDPESSPDFRRYCGENSFWLRDYALFKVIKETQDERNWESWPVELRERHPDALARFEVERERRLHFHQWLQWQLFEQFRAVKEHGEQHGVYLIGDLPFLTSRDSADVWSFQDCFKLDLLSGAPPDLFFVRGQRWGMPPYRWEAIAARGYDYLFQKLKYAENFFSLHRIDHVVGIFRVWTIAASEPEDTAGLNGKFDPPDEKDWERHGRGLLEKMLECSAMLPCGEDLGVVPACSYKVLRELAIPGMDVQKWTKDWERGGEDFLPPEKYRKNGMAIVATHDTTSFRGWWDYEAGTVEGALFERMCATRGISYDAVKGKLFDLERSRHGRMRWRADLTDKGKFLWELGKPEHEVKDFVDMYTGSFGEKARFWRFVGLKGQPSETATPILLEAALRKAHAAACIFSVQPLLDLLSLGYFWERDSWGCRINFPGTVGDWNWTLRMPVSLEEMAEMKINETIRDINRSSGRI